MNTLHEGQVERANTLEQQAAALSGNPTGMGTNSCASRRSLNEQRTLDALLEIMFAALKCSPWNSSKQTQDAFAELTLILRRYVASILAFWRVPSPWFMAEDVVQELFIRFLRKDLAAHYKQHRAARETFLLAVLRNVLFEARRKLKHLTESPLLDNLVDPTTRPDEALALSEIRDQISCAISRLRPPIADAFQAQYGLKVESQEDSRLSASTRNSRRSRARKALRLDLQKLMEA